MSDPDDQNPLRQAVFTDLYELTMAQAYDAESLDRPAVFELHFRQMPKGRNYVVAAGLESVLSYLEHWHFTDDDLDYLRSHGVFSEPFLDRLAGLAFTGDVMAVPEGTVVFPDEPLVQVEAPLLEAQLIETLVLNQVHLQSVLATKAARVVTAAAGRTVIDFGSRRAHGAEAGVKLARASYLAGAVGTSNVLAGKLYGIPVFGTMAHSYVQAHEDELDAFDRFQQLYPETTLLVDTYDTLAGVHKVVELSRRLGQRFRVRAIRLDSGNLAELAGKARKIFDRAGLDGVKIFATSGLDEYQIAELVESGAPIDGVGVGTKLAVAEDAPYLDLSYKLVEYDGRPKMKLSPGKPMYPGRKQVFRIAQDGRITRDLLGRHDEDLPGQPLLRPVMQGGKRLSAARVPLEDIRQHAREELDRLPQPLRSLQPASPPYAVQVSDRLRADVETLRRELESC